MEEKKKRKEEKEIAAVKAQEKKSEGIDWGEIYKQTYSHAELQTAGKV